MDGYTIVKSAKKNLLFSGILAALYFSASLALYYGYPYLRVYALSHTFCPSDLDCTSTGAQTSSGNLTSAGSFTTAGPNQINPEPHGNYTVGENRYATLAAAYAALPTAADGSKYGTIHLGPGIFRYSSTVKITTSGGRNDVVNLQGTCGNSSPSGPEGALPTSTILQYTGTGIGLDALATNENDRGGTISCVTFDGSQDTNSNVIGFRFGGNSGIRFVNDWFQYFSTAGSVGLEAYSPVATFNTNEWVVDHSYFEDDTVGFEGLGPNCNATSAQSNLQHHYFTAFFDPGYPSDASNQTAILITCGMQMSRGTLHLDGAAEGAGVQIISVTNGSDLDDEDLIDMIEPGDGLAHTRFRTDPTSSIEAVGLFNTYGGLFTDTGNITLYGFTNGGTGPFRAAQATIGSGSSVTSTGAGGTMASTGSTTIADLPAASSSGGQVWLVSDSTTISAEGQTCTGSSSNKAIAISNGSIWKCF